MRYMMFMIPRVYQPDTPENEKAGEGFAPPADAVEWARRVPAAGGDVIEIRQIFEMDDYPEDVQKLADNEVVRAKVETNNR